MRIAVTNKMNKWFFDSFFNVETLFFPTPSELLVGLEKFKPDVLVFGDFKNNFTEFQIDELKKIITEYNINTLFYGGWQGFGLGNYESAFFDEDMSLRFRDDELQMVIYKISAAPKNGVFSISFDDCPEIAFYNKVDISTNDYNVVLSWNDDNSSNPLLLSKESNHRKQLILLTTFTPPGGAKRLVLWRKYPSLWKEMLEWLGSDKLSYNKTENNILFSLLCNYWSGQLTHEYANKVLTTETIFFEEELLLMRDMFDRLGDWEMSSYIGEKYYQCNKDTYGDTIHTLKSLAELRKIQAYYYINQNNYCKASDNFKEGSRVWKAIDDNLQGLPNAKGFVFYFSGLSLLYHAFDNLRSSLKEADENMETTVQLLKEAEVYTDDAVNLFRQAVALNGHTYSNVMLLLCRLIRIVLMHKITKADTNKSFITDAVFLYDYKNATNELQCLLNDYSDSIKFERPQIAIDFALIENQKYEWYLKVELISLEHYTILNTISQILKDELIKFEKSISQNRYLTEKVNIDRLIECTIDLDKGSREGEKPSNCTYFVFGNIEIGKINANQVNLFELFSINGVPLSKDEMDYIQSNFIIMSKCEDYEVALSAKDRIIEFLEKKLKTEPNQVKDDIMNKIKDCFMMDIKKIKAEQVNVIKDGENIQINNSGAPKKTNFWNSGLLIIVFYFLVLLTIVVFKYLEISLYWFPLVIIGTILIFTVSGAFSLRESEKLSQKNFLELMGIVFKKLIGVGLFSKNHDNEKESDEKVQ